MATHFFVNFDTFKWLYLACYWVYQILILVSIFLPNKIAEREGHVHSLSKQNGAMYNAEYNLT